jgi:hypothetical protein
MYERAADYSVCGDPVEAPGGSCEKPGKGAVYVFEQDYVTAPYYRWSSTVDTASWGGYPTSNTASTSCDEFGMNCLASTGFCTDCANATDDGAACTAATPCGSNGACRFAPPFTVPGSKYWGQRKKLQPADLDPGDRFGASVDFDPATATIVVGAPAKTAAGRCGVNYVPGIRPGTAGDCAEAGAVYVFQKDFGGPNNWGQVAKLTTNPGVLPAPPGGTCQAGAPSNATGGDGPCPGAACEVCTNAPAGCADCNQTHFSGAKQHFGFSVSISGAYLAVGCPRCVGNNRCNGRCMDGSMCGTCNATRTTSCFVDSDCSSVGIEVCERNRCADGSYCTLWGYEQSAGKAFLYKAVGANRFPPLHPTHPSLSESLSESIWSLLGSLPKAWRGGVPAGGCGGELGGGAGGSK